MERPFQRLTAQYRRVRQGEQLLDKLTQAQNHLRNRASPVTAELLRVNIETTTVVAQSLELAVIGLDRERQQLRNAIRSAMERNGIQAA